MTMALKALGEFIRKHLLSNLTAKLMALALAVALWYYTYRVSYMDLVKTVPVKVQTASEGWSVVRGGIPEVAVTLRYPRRFDAEVKDALDKGQIHIDCNVTAAPSDLDRQVVTVALPSKDATFTTPYGFFRREDVSFNPPKLEINLIREKTVSVRVVAKTSLPPTDYDVDYAFPIPAAVVIGGQRDIVTQLARTGIETEEIDISTAPPPSAVEWGPFLLPAHIPAAVSLGGASYPIRCSDQVQCRIHLVRVSTPRTFTAIPLGLLEPPNYAFVATLHEQTSDVQVSGPKSIVEALKPENIVLYVDVRDPKLVPQETPYTQPVQAQVAGIPGGNEVVVKPAVPTCAVKISEAKPK